MSLRRGLLACPPRWVARTCTTGEGVSRLGGTKFPPRPGEHGSGPNQGGQKQSPFWCLANVNPPRNSPLNWDSIPRPRARKFMFMMVEIARKHGKRSKPAPRNTSPMDERTGTRRVAHMQEPSAITREFHKLLSTRTTHIATVDNEARARDASAITSRSASRSTQQLCRSCLARTATSAVRMTTHDARCR
jgi:hypothetical protein